MSLREKLHERMISFFPKGGHNHDGVNSTPVELQEGTIELGHLSEALSDWIRDAGGAGGAAGLDDEVSPVPDLVIETPTVGAGGSYTGEASWATMCAVRFLRILMTHDTEITITFYHVGTFADEDREFRATNCGNKFLWEGAWIHYDEGNDKKVYYKIENTGNQASSFQLTLKSGTMVANEYGNLVQSITAGSNELIGAIKLLAGDGVTIESDENGDSITVSSEDISTIPLNRWALTAVKPVAFASDGSITNESYLYDGLTHDTGRYATFDNWIQADLGVIKNLGAVQIVTYFSDGRVYYDTKIEVSADGSTWTTVKSAADHWANGEGMWAHIPKGILARYVRYTSNGSDQSTGNHIVKLIAYAISDKG